MSSHELNSRAAARPTSTNPIRSLGVGLLVASAAVGALAADKTVSVSERIDLAAAPSRTWDAIKDFKGWQAWHPAFASTEIVKGAGNTKGTVRVLTAKDGAKFTEELVSFNAASRTYQYHIIESPLPITGYVSTLEVKENKTGSSVVWSSNFKVKDGTPDEDSGLLEPANTDRGALRFEPRMFDVCATATDAVHACRSAINARLQTLEVQVPSTPIEVRGDPGQIAQVLVNLLNNATAYPENGGRISLSIEVVGASVVMTVSDSGMGIAPEALSDQCRHRARQPVRRLDPDGADAGKRVGELLLGLRRRLADAGENLGRLFGWHVRTLFEGAGGIAHCIQRECGRAQLHQTGRETFNP